MQNVHFSAGVILAAYKARRYVSDHGASLAGLLCKVAGDRGLEVFRVVEQLQCDIKPDPVRFGVALNEILDLIANADAVEKHDTACLRWHRARLACLCKYLPRTRREPR